MLSTAATVRGSPPGNTPGHGRSTPGGRATTRQQQRLERAGSIQNDVIQVDRMQRCAADSFTDRKDLRGGSAFADDGDAMLGILGGDGSSQQQVGRALRRVALVLRGGSGRRNAEQVRRHHGLNVPRRNVERAGRRRCSDRLGDFEGLGI